MKVLVHPNQGLLWKLTGFYWTFRKEVFQVQGEVSADLLNDLLKIILDEMQGFILFLLW